MRAVVVAKLLLVIETLFGCDLLMNRDVKLPDFGMEKGYFYEIWDPGSEIKEQAIKIELMSDLNHLSIRFYEEYEEAHHVSVLKEYGIEIVMSQPFGKTVPMPGYYRVRRQPAEAYYTSYGDTTLERLGNLPEVENVLPVFWLNEQFWDLKLTPDILLSFHEHISEERQSAILDSLVLTDKVKVHKKVPDLPYWPETIYVTKSSLADPYSLYHDYYQLPFFKAVSMNFNFTARWLGND